MVTVGPVVDGEYLAVTFLLLISLLTDQEVPASE